MAIKNMEGQKMKKTFKILALLIVVLSVTACSSKPKEEPAKTASVDSVSSASTSYYYEDSSIKEDSEEFLEIMKNPAAFGAVTVSTTNADGSPNVGVIIPSMVDVENKFVLLSFGTNGSTKQNLIERKIGVITVFKADPTAEDKADRYVGMRIIVEYAEDHDKVINDLIAKEKIKEKNKDTSVIVQIKKVIPLG